MRKKTKIGLGIFAGVLLVAYLSLWVYSAQWFAKEIDKLYAQNGEDGVNFLGEKPILVNFPFVPEVYYTRGMRIGNADVMFPEVKLRGYPLPGTALTVEFPQGISLGGIVDPTIWQIDSLKTRLTIPFEFPADLSYESLAAWRDGGGAITVQNYELTKGALISDGKGHLFLDDQMQPDLSFESEIRGYQEFISEQQAANLIEPFAGAIGTTILNGLSKTDPETGDSVVHITVTVKNRILSAGPLQALELPPIVWDRRN